MIVRFMIIICGSSSSSIRSSSSSSSSSSSIDRKPSGESHPRACSKSPTRIPDRVELPKGVGSGKSAAVLGIHNRGVQSEGGAADGGSIM